MATQRSNEPEPLGIVGSISRSAGTMVGTVAAVGRKIAGLGVRGVEIVRGNGLRTQVAALESDIAAVWRKLKKVRSGQKEAKPGEKSQGKQAKVKRETEKPKRPSHPRKRPTSKAGVETKVAIGTQEPQPRVVKVKRSGGKSDKTAILTEPEAKIQPLQSVKTGPETKVVTESQKPQARTSDVKPVKKAPSTELETKNHRLEDELGDLKYPPVDLEDEYFDD